MIRITVLLSFCAINFLNLSSTGYAVEDRIPGNGSSPNFFEDFESQGRESQGLIRKLVSYLRSTLIPRSTSYSRTETRKEIKVDARLPAYENSRELPDAGDFPETFEDSNVDEPFKILEKRRDVTGSVGNGTDEKRGLQIYLFQGQYLPEPRLNRFVDGVMDNLGQEMKLATLDPLYFLVMPKGKVIGRPKPIKRFPGNKPFRQRPGRVLAKKFQNFRPLLSERNFTRHDGIGTRLSQSRRGRQRRPVTGRQRQNQKGRKNRVVGAGRVEGMSKVLRDGDAEMQLFGNYTLIRSHYNMGPLYLVMQFRTIRGIRRANAILEKIKIHTVTRVNTQGCEMIDFLLDRPHAETIEIRGQLFPLATRVAKNIFSRLFAGDSFLVARIREKTGLALLSKKTSF